jgi:hypothetical protein
MTSSYLSPEQVAGLLRPINPKRVAKLDGLSHLEAYDVRAHLNRVFGFGRWSEELVELVELFALETTTKAGKPAVNVGYRATVRLTVCAPDGTTLATYTEAAAGDSQMPTFKRGDCYDMAIKTAESQALKRCATNLGDQFGLSLYRNGSQEALVLATLVGAPEQSKKDEAPDAQAPAVVPEVREDAGEDKAEPMARPADPKAEAEQWATTNAAPATEPPRQPAGRPAQRPGPIDRPQPITPAQLTALNAGLVALGYTKREDKLALLSSLLDRSVTSSAELTLAEGSRLIEATKTGGIAPNTPAVRA